MLYDRHAPIVSPTSHAEFDRRRAAVQAELKKLDVDCVLLYSSYLRQSGGLRYFLDFPTCGTNAAFAILPAEGDLSVFGHGFQGGTTVPKNLAYKLEENFGYPYACVMNVTLPHLFEGVVKYVKKHNFHKIGLYRKGLLPYAFVQSVVENCENVSIIDCDDAIDHVMAIKSPEELGHLRAVCELHDNVYGALKALVRPGKREKDLANEIRDLCFKMDCEETNIMIGAGNPVAHHTHYPFQTKEIRENDFLDLLVEVGGPGNYYGELSRMWALGEPSDELVRVNNDCLKIQDILQETARPGVPARHMMEVLLDFQKENGYKPEGRFFGHSQGVDLTQRPVFRLEETMLLDENMFISIHPALETLDGSMWVMNTDNYIITKDGTERINKTPRGIFRP